MNYIQDLILKDDKTVIWATTHLKFTKLKIKNFRLQDGGLGGLSPSLGLEVCITEITFWLSPILILHFFQRWCRPRWGGVGCSSSSSSSGWPARLKAPQKQGSLYPMSKKSCLASELAVFWGKKLVASQEHHVFIWCWGNFSLIVFFQWTCFCVDFCWFYSGELNTLPRAAQVVPACQPCCEKMEGKWENENEMDR